MAPEHKWHMLFRWLFPNVFLSLLFISVRRLRDSFQSFLKLNYFSASWPNRWRRVVVIS